jgi:hypothetical protein
LTESSRRHRGRGGCSNNGMISRSSSI